MTVGQNNLFIHFQVNFQTEDFSTKKIYDDDMITEVHFLNLPNGCDDDEEIV